MSDIQEISDSRNYAKNALEKTARIGLSVDARPDARSTLDDYATALATFVSSKAKPMVLMAARIADVLDPAMAPMVGSPGPTQVFARSAATRPSKPRTGPSSKFEFKP